MKKTEHWRTDDFELWCWRRLKRALWTTRSNQSILKEIFPGYPLLGLLLKLKLWYFGHMMWRDNSLEETLMLGKIESKRRKGWWRLSWLEGITNSMDMNLQTQVDSEGKGSLVCYSSWCCRESDLMTEQ